MIIFDGANFRLLGHLPGCRTDSCIHACVCCVCMCMLSERECERERGEREREREREREHSLKNISIVSIVPVIFLLHKATILDIPYD